MKPLHLTRESVFTTIVVFGWLVTVASGLLYFNKYEATPGPAIRSSDRWPVDSAITCSPDKINLIVFAHPRCPCTSSSLDELQALLTDCPVPVATRIMFWVPPNATSAWTASDLWKRAAAIPNVQLLADEAGQEAQRFGATTSGHLMIFRPDETRIYSGGLTNGRGKSGNHAGLAAIRSLLVQRQSLPIEASVFGCPLFKSQSTSDNGTELCQQPL